MAIYTLSKDEKIALNFVFERIYLRRNGSTDITVDLLVENRGTSPIDRLRVALPYSLIDIEKAKDCNLNAAAKAFGPFRTAQAKCVEIHSDQLLTAGHTTNWAYRTLPHVKLGDPDGKINVRRIWQVQGKSDLSAPIKRFWNVASPPETEVDMWMWFLFAANEVTLIDLVAPPIVPRPNEPDERLLAGERMWMRLVINLPAEGIGLLPKS